MCWEWKEVASFDGNENDQRPQRWSQRRRENPREQKWCSSLMRRRTLSRDLLPHLDQSITELLRCYLALLTVASGTREHGRQSVVSAPTRPGIVTHQVEPRTTAAAAGTIAGPRISFWLLRPGLCLHMDVRLQTELFMLNDVLHDFSRHVHICHTCSGWTCSRLWRAQGAIGGPASSGIL